VDITELLNFTVKNKASDLHLSAHMPPMLRIDGKMQRIDTPAIEHAKLQEMLFSIMSTNQQQQLQQKLELDFSVTHNNARFRVNIFMHNRGVGAAFRVIPAKILSLAELYCPKIFSKIAEFPRGLILVTGPTGSGKSTTLAAMIDYINSAARKNILTIEDPIEFIHTSKKSLISQREVYKDTHSFQAALKSALREDPDIILVGELRDQETIRLALTAAETGHLVFATLHTSSAAKTIDRIVDVFPGEEKNIVRSMLSESLRAVIAQTLVERIGGGRVAAFEIMLGVSAIRNLIREAKVAQMYSILQTSKEQGMQTLDQHLAKLANDGIISETSAQAKMEYKDKK